MHISTQLFSSGVCNDSVDLDVVAKSVASFPFLYSVCFGGAVGCWVSHGSLYPPGFV